MSIMIDNVGSVAHRIVEEAAALSDATKRLVAVTILKSIKGWPDTRDAGFLAYIESAPAEEKEAALAAAINTGAAQIEAGDYVQGTVNELMVGIRARRSFDGMTA